MPTLNRCASTYYSKASVKRPISKRPKIGFQDQSSLNAGQKYRRMLQGEHSAILSTFIKLRFVFEFFVLSIFEWLFYIDFTVTVRLITDRCGKLNMCDFVCGASSSRLNEIEYKEISTLLLHIALV